MATELRRYAMYRQMCEKGRATEANAAILAAVNAARMIDPDLRAYDFDGKSDLPGHDTALPPKDRAVLRAGKLFLMMELLRKDCPTIMDNYARAKRKATIKLTRARPLSIHDTVALLSNAAQKDLFPFFRSFGVYADAAETKFRAVFAERPANAGRR